MHVRRGHAVCIALCTMETMQYMHNQKYAVHNVKCAGYAICTMCKMCTMCRAQCTGHNVQGTGGMQGNFLAVKGQEMSHEPQCTLCTKVWIQKCAFLVFLHQLCVDFHDFKRSRHHCRTICIFKDQVFGHDGKLTSNIII